MRYLQLTGAALVVAMYALRPRREELDKANRDLKSWLESIRGQGEG